MRKLLAVVALLGLFAGTARADFVLGGTSLTTNKQDLFPTPVGANPLNYITAADYNAVAQAAIDLRLAITGATSGFVLKLGDGSAVGVSATGTGALRYNNSTHAFEQSLNGGAWTGFGGGGSTGNWVFSGNNADLSGAGPLTLGNTVATSVKLIPTTLNFPSALSFAATAQGATNTVGLTLAPNVADGASSVGLVINNVTDLSSGKYLSIQGAGTEQFSIKKNGTAGVLMQGDTSTPFVRISSTSGTVIGYGTATLQAATAQYNLTDGTATLTSSAGAFSLSGNTTINLNDGTVTQATSLTTGVTVNASTGVITTVSATTVAQATATFTVTNSHVSTGSSVVVSLGAYSGTFGTNGTPIVTVSSVGAGSFAVTIYNAHATAALSGTLKIHFHVL